MSTSTLQYQPNSAHIEAGWDILNDELVEALNVELHNGVHLQLTPRTKRSPLAHEGSPSKTLYLIDPRDAALPARQMRDRLDELESRTDEIVTHAARSGALSARGMLLAQSELGLSRENLGLGPARSAELPAPPTQPEQIFLSSASEKIRSQEIARTIFGFERAQRALTDLFQSRIDALSGAASDRSDVTIYRFDRVLADGVQNPPAGVRFFGDARYYTQLDHGTGQAYVMIGNRIEDRHALALRVFDKAIANRESLPFNDVEATADGTRPLQSKPARLTLAETAGLLDVLSPSPRHTWLDHLIDHRVDRVGNAKAAAIGYDLVVESTSAMLTKAAEKLLEQRNASEGRDQQRRTEAQSR